MKFIPWKYHESQHDWFGKQGIPWHMSVAMRKESTSDAGKYETLTMCYVFRSCSQDSCATLSVTSDVLRDLKDVMPHLQRVYYWQDNTGCYHCCNTISLAHMVGNHHCVTVKRMGLGTEGLQLQNTTWRFTWIPETTLKRQKKWKKPFCQPVECPRWGWLCGPPKAPASLNIKLEGMGSISNVQYDEKGMWV